MSQCRHDWPDRLLPGTTTQLHLERTEPYQWPSDIQLTHLHTLQPFTGHNYIGTEHILLGLLREGEGVAARVLETLGADPAKIRTQVRIEGAIVLMGMNMLVQLQYDEPHPCTAFML